MSEKEFVDYLKDELNISISDEALKKLDLFAKLLIDYNKHTNITAITNINDIYLKHFYDSLSLIKVIDLNNNFRLLDVGSGGGFPGIVLAIVFPNLNITLLDSNNKKSKFQEYIVNELGLKNVEVINDRAENYYNKGNKYDIVVARAVANLTILSELCIPFVQKDGYFIAMKGDSEEEIENSKYAIKFLGGKIETINSFELPILGDKRNLVKIKKEKDTPKGYPRAYDRIIKKPLKDN